MNTQRFSLLSHIVLFLSLAALFSFCETKGKNADQTGNDENPVEYRGEKLFLMRDKLIDGKDTVKASFYDSRKPQMKYPFRLKNTTPMMQGLYNSALSDVESLIRYYGKDSIIYFGAGEKFKGGFWSRDVAYAGLLGLNKLYPKEMKQSLWLGRKLRKEAGLNLPDVYFDNGFKADWKKAGTKKAFKEKYFTGPLVQRTDDFVWVWAYYDLIKQSKESHEFEYLYQQGKHFFENYYSIFYDPSDGLYFGQASFIDIFMGEPQKWLNNTDKTTGYPQHWTFKDCIHIKTPSTNALAYKALLIMAELSETYGDGFESETWRERADKLKASYLKTFLNADGSLAYYIHPTEGKSDKREALGTALAVLTGLLDKEQAQKALKSIPVTERGVPVIYPLFDHGRYYHNDATWPFVDAFYLWAWEKAYGEDMAAKQAAIIGRTTKKDGTFHEVVHFSSGEIRGSKSQLWSAAGFLNACLRKGLIAFDNQ